MLLPVSERCNQTPNSMSPYPAGLTARSLAETQALDRAVASGVRNSTGMWFRSPWDFRNGGLNLMKDVQRTNARVTPIVAGPFGADRRGAAFRSANGPLANMPSVFGVRDGLARTQPASARECPGDGVGINVVPFVNGMAPAPVWTTSQPPISPVPARPGCPKPSGNICLDLRNGLVLASQVSPDVLYACSQKGYVGVCPSCGPGGGPVSADAAAIRGGAAVDPLSLGPCAGMGDTGSAYPVSCSGSSANPINQISLSDISPWWWLAGGVALILLAGSAEGPRPTRRAARRQTRRAA